MKRLAYYDYLTGLPNKRLFNERLNKCIFDAAGSGKTFGVLFLDLDSFKRVNDTMGHATGDELLKTVSKRLTNMFKLEDTVCRVGGDEFLILINNLEEDYNIEKLADRIIHIFKQRFRIGSHDFLLLQVLVVLFTL